MNEEAIQQETPTHVVRDDDIQSFMHNFKLLSTGMATGESFAAQYETMQSWMDWI
jgi:hypothetical protein